MIRKCTYINGSYFVNVFLDAFDAEHSQDEPELQRSEASSEWNLPILFYFITSVLSMLLFWGNSRVVHWLLESRERYSETRAGGKWD